MASPAEPNVNRRVAAPKAVLAVASSGIFMAFVDATIVNTVFPDIRRSFDGTTIGGLSWIFNAYNLVFAAFLIPAGRLADLLGRRRVFRLGILLFTLGSVLCAIAPSVGSLIAARVVQAAGAATIVPASLALVLHAFPSSERAHAVALWTAVAALAAGIGPSLGGLLVELGGWRLAFLVNLPCGAAALFAARGVLIESRVPGRRTMPDLPGALVLALAIAVITLAIVQGNDWGWGSAAVLGAFAAGAALLVGFVGRSRRHRSPLIDPELLRIRGLSVANALTVVAGAAFFSYTLCNVLFLTSVWDYSVLAAGLALTPGPLVAALVAGPLSKLVARRGYRAVLVPGSMVWCAGVGFLIAAVGTTPAFLSQWLPAMVILGAGAGAVFPTLSSAAVAVAPGERFAIATSLNSVARQLGAVLGVALLVAIIGTPSPGEVAAAFDDGWAFAALSFFIVAIGSIFLAPVEQGIEPVQALSPAPTLVTRRRPPSVTVGAGAAARVSAFLTESSAPTRQSPAEFLRSVPLFADLPDELREQVLGRSSMVRVRAGEWLFREGDPADGLYLVRSGRVELVQEDGGKLALGKGAVLGELGLVSRAPRSASVRAVRDTELLALARDSFEELLRDSPGFALALVRVLSDRLRASRAYPPPRRPLPATVALVALERDLPVRDLANRLADSFGRLGGISLLDGSERSIEDGDDPYAVYAPMLDRLERSHQRALLVAATPHGDDPWTDLCLQQADRILALTRGGHVPEWVQDVPALQGCDLVCCPSDTADWAPWVTALRPANTHRLATGEDEGADLDRIARRLSGRAVGIVLSGGGARAFAHIGAIEELLAAGVEIDRVGGASMGAFIGGLLAMGRSPAEIDAHCYEEWVRRNPLNDYTLPRTSLIRGEKVTAMVQDSFAGLSVEDLELNFYAVSADLRTGQLIVHRHGALWQAVGASMSLPVLVPPQMPAGRVLVDGGVINNLPVDAMAATGEGPIVAVDVKPKSRPRDRQAVAENGRPAVREVRPPKLLETLYRVILLGSASTSDLAQRYADVVITPRVEGVALLEFHQIDQAREAGRQAAREVLEQSPQALLV